VSSFRLCANQPSTCLGCEECLKLGDTWCYIDELVMELPS